MRHLPTTEHRDQQHGREVKPPGDRAIADHRRHRPGDAADQGGPVGASLEPVGVDPRIDHQPDHCQPTRQRIAAAPQQAKTAGAQDDPIACGSGHPDDAQCQWPMTGAHHAPVDVAVNAVVDDTTAPDHQGGAEQGGKPVRHRGHMPAGGEQVTAQHRGQVTDNNARLGELDSGIEQPPPVFQCASML